MLFTNDSTSIERSERAKKAFDPMV